MVDMRCVMISESLLATVTFAQPTYAKPQRAEEDHLVAGTSCKVIHSKDTGTKDNFLCDRSLVYSRQL